MSIKQWKPCKTTNVVTAVVSLLLVSPCFSQTGILGLYQGSYRTYSQKIAQYQYGGIYGANYMSPYYTHLRGNLGNSNPANATSIRGVMDTRRSRYDNRRELNSQGPFRSFTPSVSLPIPGIHRSNAMSSTGHPTRFMTYP